MPNEWQLLLSILLVVRSAGPSRAFSSGISFIWIPPTSWITNWFVYYPSGTPHIANSFTRTTVNLEVLISPCLP